MTGSAPTLGDRFGKVQQLLKYFWLLSNYIQSVDKVDKIPVTKCPGFTDKMFLTFIFNKSSLSMFIRSQTAKHFTIIIIRCCPKKDKVIFWEGRGQLKVKSDDE